jgi:hypothetical protein
LCAFFIDILLCFAAPHSVRPWRLTMCEAINELVVRTEYLTEPSKKVTNESIIEKTHSPTIGPFVLRLSKDERLGHPLFDKLRVNGVLFLSEQKEREFSSQMSIQLWTDYMIKLFSLSSRLKGSLRSFDEAWTWDNRLIGREIAISPWYSVLSPCRNKHEG